LPLPTRDHDVVLLLCHDAIVSPAEMLRAALELHDVGVALMRQNLRRRHPDATDERIEELLVTWLNAARCRTR